MKHEKNSLLLIGTLLAILSVVGRFSILGWMGLFGLLSITIFGFMQALLLGDIRDYFDILPRFNKNLAWWVVFIFPLIFLFQFDFGDSAGTPYVYYYLIGEQNEWVERHAIFVALFAAVAYLILFIVWKKELKKLKSKLN